MARRLLPSSSRNGSDVFLLVGAIFTVIGLIGIVTSVAVGLTQYAADQARSATGVAVITEVYSVRSDSGGRTCGAVYEYTVDNSSYGGETRGGTSNLFCGLREGHQTPLRYNPANPSDSVLVIAQDSSLLFSLIVGGLAAVFLGVGVVLFIAWRRTAGEARLRTDAENRPTTEEPHGLNLAPDPGQGWQPYPGPNSTPE